jgi:hypothetical protein
VVSVDGYHVVLNIDLTHNITALRHNKIPHIIQETKQCWEHGVSIEKGINFN